MSDNWKITARTFLQINKNNSDTEGLRCCLCYLQGLKDGCEGEKTSTKIEMIREIDEWTKEHIKTPQT